MLKWFSRGWGNMKSFVMVITFKNAVVSLTMVALQAGLIVDEHTCQKCVLIIMC
jgi:hypothetical protein